MMLAGSENGAGGEADEVLSEGEGSGFIEVVDAPDQAALGIAPGAEVFHVQITDGENVESARQLRAEFGPELDSAIESSAKEAEGIVRHGPVLLLEIGWDKFEMSAKPFFIASGGLGDAHECER